MLLTRVTPAQTNQRRVIPVVVCFQSARKKRKCGEQMKLADSSSLELQIQLASPAISIVASAAKTFQCWRMAHMKSWVTFKVRSLLPVISDWDWRQLAGESWVLRETPSVRVKWIAKGSAFFEVLWSSGIEKLHLLRIWLWTILERRMPRYQYLPRCRR